MSGQLQCLRNMTPFDADDCHNRAANNNVVVTYIGLSISFQLPSLGDAEPGFLHSHFIWFKHILFKKKNTIGKQGVALY